jgi:hypothetical protein
MHLCNYLNISGLCCASVGCPAATDSRGVELHYLPKKGVVDGFEKYQQFGIINFCARRGGEVRLTQAVKNKWPIGWTKAWFYYKVPLHACSQGGKSVHALHSHMSCLNFRMNPSFDCADDGLSNGTFVWASKHNGGQDAMKEFIACNIWPMAVGISFEQVKVGVTSVSKLKVLLSRFVVAREDDEDDVKFLARAEKEARVLGGSYTRPEHKAYAVLLNNGCLNRVLELAGVAYGPHPVSVSVEVLKKRKVDSVGKTISKGLKALEKKRAKSIKTSAASVKIDVKQPFDVNVASPESTKLCKKTIPHTIASAADAHGTLLASGSKIVPGALDLVTAGGHPRSKTIGGTSALKPPVVSWFPRVWLAQRRVSHPLRNVVFPRLGPWLGRLRKSLKTHRRVVQ